MKVEGKKVVVVGMAKSGRAAVDLLIERGAQVAAVDREPGHALPIPILPQTPAAFVGADLIVLSPGVPADLADLAPSRDRGVPIVGDLELASWFLKGEVIGITGSNGKTTTTALTGHILKSSGIPAQVGGNIGTPPCSMVNTSRPNQWNVLELSSFQLETIDTFRAHIGVALNVTPDHLDRHYTLERYAAAKARLFENQCPTDFAVLNADDPTTKNWKDAGAGRPVWFSAGTADADAYLRELSFTSGARWTFIMLSGESLMASADVPLLGTHNLENTMAAALAARLAGATHDQIREAVKTFPGVEHRLEFVRLLDGVTWYNDSKATNVDATLKAIAAFDGALWIILGGKDKNTDYTPLAEPLKQKAHAVLLIGAAAEKIAAQLHDSAPMLPCGTLEAAITEARARAHSGDTVLLAPACASFDQFENFEHRGREFKRLVQSLE